MSVETDYDPKYVELEDIPLSGPDDYSSEAKRKALFHAESSLELDANNGEEIQPGDLTNSHKSAVINLATHVLTHAAEEPSDVTIGDMQSGGGTATEYSSRYLDEYKRIIEALVESGSGGHGNFSVAVNSGYGSDTGRYDEKYDTGAPDDFHADEEDGDTIR
jgi:hypothetical protein